MCETTAYLERHPKAMDELLDIVRICRRISEQAAALRKGAHAVRLSISFSTDEEAHRGPALEHE